MKKTKVLYWVVTGLMVALMLLASIPDILMLPDAVEFLKHLGYPAYLLPFLGVAKTLAVITILVPGFSKLKEWAYAGLVFDLIGALYSHISVGDPITVWIFPLIVLILVFGSYYLYRKGFRKSESSD
jgi:hypothetical protein